MPATADWLARATALQAALDGMRGVEVPWGPSPHAAPGVISTFPTYPQAVWDLWPLLQEVGVGTPARYHDWRAGRDRLPATAADFAACSLEDVAMNFLTLSRAERFCDGVWAEALTSGALATGLARLIQLADALPYRAELGSFAPQPPTGQAPAGPSVDGGLGGLVRRLFGARTAPGASLRGG